MRRLVVLFTLFALGAAAVAASGLGVIACGGNDKPPLTPDSADPMAMDGADGGAAPGPGPAPTAPPAK